MLRGFILWALPAFTLVLGEYVCETGKVQRMKDLCKVDDNLMNNSGLEINIIGRVGTNAVKTDLEVYVRASTSACVA